MGRSNKNKNGSKSRHNGGGRDCDERFTNFFTQPYQIPNNWDFQFFSEPWRNRLNNWRGQNIPNPLESFHGSAGLANQQLGFRQQFSWNNPNFQSFPLPLNAARVSNHAAPASSHYPKPRGKTNFQKASDKPKNTKRAKSPLPGSEEARKKEIAQAADKLKLCLMTFKNKKSEVLEDLLSKDDGKNEATARTNLTMEGTSRFVPELRLTPKDLQDIGKVNTVSATIDASNKDSVEPQCPNLGELSPETLCETSDVLFVSESSGRTLLGTVELDDSDNDENSLNRSYIEDVSNEVSLQNMEVGADIMNDFESATDQVEVFPGDVCVPPQGDFLSGQMVSSLSSFDLISCSNGINENLTDNSLLNDCPQFPSRLLDKDIASEQQQVVSKRPRCTSETLCQSVVCESETLKSKGLDTSARLRTRSASLNTSEMEKDNSVSPQSSSRPRSQVKQLKENVMRQLLSMSKTRLRDIVSNPRSSKLEFVMKHLVKEHHMVLSRKLRLLAENRIRGLQEQGCCEDDSENQNALLDPDMDVKLSAFPIEVIEQLGSLLNLDFRNYTDSMDKVHDLNFGDDCVSEGLEDLEALQEVLCLENEDIADLDKGLMDSNRNHCSSVGSFEGLDMKIKTESEIDNCKELDRTLLGTPDIFAKNGGSSDDCWEGRNTSEMDIGLAPEACSYGNIAFFGGTIPKDEKSQPTQDNLLSDFEVLGSSRTQDRSNSSEVLSSSALETVGEELTGALTADLGSQNAEQSVLRQTNKDLRDHLQVTVLEQDETLQHISELENHSSPISRRTGGQLQELEKNRSNGTTLRNSQLTSSHRMCEGQPHRNGELQTSSVFDASTQTQPLEEQDSQDIPNLIHVLEKSSWCPDHLVSALKTCVPSADSTLRKNSIRVSTKTGCIKKKNRSDLRKSNYTVGRGSDGPGTTKPFKRRWNRKNRRKFRRHVMPEVQNGLNVFPSDVVNNTFSRVEASAQSSDPQTILSCMFEIHREMERLMKLHSHFSDRLRIVSAHSTLNRSIQPSASSFSRTPPILFPSVDVDMRPELPVSEETSSGSNTMCEDRQNLSANHNCCSSLVTALDCERTCDNALPPPLTVASDINEDIRLSASCVKIEPPVLEEQTLISTGQTSIDVTSKEICKKLDVNHSKNSCKASSKAGKDLNNLCILDDNEGKNSTSKESERKSGNKLSISSSSQKKSSKEYVPVKAVETNKVRTDGQSRNRNSDPLKSLSSSTDSRKDSHCHVENIHIKHEEEKSTTSKQTESVKHGGRSSSGDPGSKLSDLSRKNKKERERINEKAKTNTHHSEKIATDSSQIHQSNLEDSQGKECRASDSSRRNKKMKKMVNEKDKLNILHSENVDTSIVGSSEIHQNNLEESSEAGSRTLDHSGRSKKVKQTVVEKDSKVNNHHSGKVDSSIVDSSQIHQSNLDKSCGAGNRSSSHSRRNRKARKLVNEKDEVNTPLSEKIDISTVGSSGIHQSSLEDSCDTGSRSLDHSGRNVEIKQMVIEDSEVKSANTDMIDNLSVDNSHVHQSNLDNSCGTGSRSSSHSRRNKKAKKVVNEKEVNTPLSEKIDNSTVGSSEIHQSNLQDSCDIESKSPDLSRRNRKVKKMVNEKDEINSLHSTVGSSGMHESNLEDSWVTGSKSPDLSRRNRKVKKMVNKKDKMDTLHSENIDSSTVGSSGMHKSDLEDPCFTDSRSLDHSGRNIKVKQMVIEKDIEITNFNSEKLDSSSVDRSKVQESNLDSSHDTGTTSSNHSRRNRKAQKIVNKKDEVNTRLSEKLDDSTVDSSEIHLSNLEDSCDVKVKQMVIEMDNTANVLNSEKIDNSIVDSSVTQRSSMDDSCDIGSQSSDPSRRNIKLREMVNKTEVGKLKCSEKINDSTEAPQNNLEDSYDRETDQPPRKMRGRRSKSTAQGATAGDIISKNSPELVTPGLWNLSSSLDNTLLEGSITPSSDRLSVDIECYEEKTKPRRLKRRREDSVLSECSDVSTDSSKRSLLQSCAIERKTLPSQSLKNAENVKQFSESGTLTTRKRTRTRSNDEGFTKCFIPEIKDCRVILERIDITKLASIPLSQNMSAENLPNVNTHDSQELDSSSSVQDSNEPMKGENDDSQLPKKKNTLTITKIFEKLRSENASSPAHSDPTIEIESQLALLEEMSSHLFEHPDSVDEEQLLGASDQETEDTKMKHKLRTHREKEDLNEPAFDISVTDVSKTKRKGDPSKSSFDISVTDVSKTEGKEGLSEPLFNISVTDLSKTEGKEDLSGPSFDISVTDVSKTEGKEDLSGPSFGISVADVSKIEGKEALSEPSFDIGVKDIPKANEGTEDQSEPILDVKPKTDNFFIDENSVSTLVSDISVSESEQMCALSAVPDETSNTHGSENIDISSCGAVENQSKPTAKHKEKKFKEPDQMIFESHEGSILDIKTYGRLILAACEDGKVYCYSLRSGKLKRTIEGHGDKVACLFIPECPKSKQGEEATSDLLFTGCFDHHLRCFNLRTGDMVRDAVNIGGPVQCMEMNWETIFVGTKVGKVARFFMKSFKLADDVIECSQSPIMALKTTREGPRKVLIVATSHEAVTIRDATTGLLLRSFGLPQTVFSLILDTSFVYCGTKTGEIVVLSFTSGEESFRLKAGNGVSCMKIFNNLLFAGCYDGYVYMYSIPDQKMITRIEGGKMMLCLDVIKSKIIAGSKCKLQALSFPAEIKSYLRNFKHRSK